jgi:hypothetical protein
MYIYITICGNESKVLVYFRQNSLTLNMHILPHYDMYLQSIVEFCSNFNILTSPSVCNLVHILKFRL